MKPLSQKQKDELENTIRSSRKTGEVLRAQTILMLDERESHVKVKRMTGFSKTHAFHLRRAYVKNGIESLKDKREGKPKALLTAKQREKVLETVKTKTPKDCGFVSEHWSTGILGEWIKKKFKVEYKSKTSLYLVFKQAKFTYHRPGQAYDLRNEETIKEWKTKKQTFVTAFLARTSNGYPLR